jgi:hypothetical protein
VGVNGGRADDLHPCLGPSSAYPSYTQSELYWALATATGGTAQPNASLYLNTADPGNVYNRKPIGDWPTSGNTPYGSCTTTAVRIGHTTYTLGQNSAACAWQYGYNMAVQDAGWLSAEATRINAQEQSVSVSVSGAASSYPWWLDVETAHTWQSGTSGQAMNSADLQGMIAALQASPNSVKAVGAYSTSSQWNQITGGTSTSAAGTLYGIPQLDPGRDDAVRRPVQLRAAFVHRGQCFADPVDRHVRQRLRLPLRPVGREPASRMRLAVIAGLGAVGAVASQLGV